MRACLILDLQDSPALIQEYLTYHRNVWPEILASIRESGIRNMEIYSVEDRLIMMIDADPEFSFARKAELDNGNPAVQRWEALMSQFQKPLRNTPHSEKWRLAPSIFSLQESLSASDARIHTHRNAGEPQAEPNGIAP